MHTHHTKTIRKNERGFASIVISLVLIIILGLLTVGFAQLARREQQNSLDKQLASQAYDAAESGVNAAYHDITTIDPATITPLNPNGEPYINTSNVPPSLSNTCLTSSNVPTNGNGGLDYTTTANQTLDTQNGVSYTCLMVNLQPPNLKYDNVLPDSARSITFSTPVTSGTLDNLIVKWNTYDNQTATPSFPTASNSFGFPSVASWNSPAVLEVSLTPLPSGSFNRNSLINGTYTTYLYPSTSDASAPYLANDTHPGSQGLIEASSCTSAGSCTGTISGLSNLANNPDAAPGASYILHILDYYDESQTITVNGTNAGGSSVNFIGQDLIDVTGKAQYVLKRLQEQVQPNSQPTLPTYAIEGQNICKRFNTFPSATTPDTSVSGLGNCTNFN